MINSPEEILFCILIYIAVLLLFFSGNRKARFLFLNLIPSFVLLVSLLLKKNGIESQYIEHAASAALLIYPFPFILNVIDYFPIDIKNHLFESLVISVFFIILYLIYGNFSIIMIQHLVLYTYLFIIIKEKFINKIQIIIFMIFPSLFLFYYVNHYHRIDHLMIALVLLCVFSTLFAFFVYSRRIRFINTRMLSINSLNKRLNQVITRLRQSNDTLKKIISQKDIELLQIARHASLAEVTTGIAHELAQPLTGIKCISQNMIDDINYNDLDHMQAVSDLVKISSLVDRSSSIIDHIRTFSRKRGFSFQQADLNACILNAIDLINNQISNSGIDLIFVLDDTIPRIYGDNLSLEQLFINLILNAKDAISSRKESNAALNGTIKITTTYNDTNVKLIIQDNGSGIPENIIPKIWTPFFTTKQKGKGTGIGLSLSHRIIKEHNADVSIESSSQGTVFTITFPTEYSQNEEQL